MALINLTDYGAVPNDETYDNGPAFAQAISACRPHDTLVIPEGAWNVITYPSISGALPAVQADIHAVIELHLDTDYYGVLTTEALQKFLIWHSFTGVAYGWRMLGLGVTG